MAFIPHVSSIIFINRLVMFHIVCESVTTLGKGIQQRDNIMLEFYNSRLKVTPGLGLDKDCNTALVTERKLIKIILKEIILDQPSERYE